MMLANTSPICCKPPGSSRLVRIENLNDHAAEDPCSQLTPSSANFAHGVGMARGVP
jgi:hypothetical protein